MAGYSLTIGPGALDHLGVNLYGSLPAALSEAVANAWDADAENVSIDADSDSITIRDDGHGMTRDECNEKFLAVGYARRSKDGGGKTPGGRAAIGRKGIGTLSLFSIADMAEIHTVKDGDPAQRAGFVMDINKIRRKIEEDGRSPATTCELEEVAGAKIKIERGTMIRLTGLNKRMGRVAKAVRKNLARRFSIIDPARGFSVSVNGDPVAANDRDCLTKLEYVWYMGDEGKRITRRCRRREEIDETVDRAKEYRVCGWVGTAKRQEDIDGGNNRIAVMARGKIIHEDVLPGIKEGGIFSKYLVGEIQADFLDMDGEDDIATSSRQSVIEGDPRFVALKEYVQRAVTEKIQSRWTRLRAESAKGDALSDPAVKKWFGGLAPGGRTRAERLFRRIQTYKGLETDAKIGLYKSGIAAFEALAMHDHLSRLDRVSEDGGPGALVELLGGVDRLEAARYLDTARRRLKVLKTFTGLADENAREKAMQRYLPDHLWLLDPSWERAGEDRRMEEKFKAACGDADAGLAKGEESARVDIRYRTSAGTHIIVELKRRGARESIDDLSRRVHRYSDAMEKVLGARREDSPQISIVCVLGSEPGPGTDSKRKQEALKVYNGRYVTYESLIRGARRAYGRYVDEWKGVKDVMDLVEKIEFPSSSPSSPLPRRRPAIPAGDADAGQGRRALGGRGRRQGRR